MAAVTATAPVPACVWTIEADQPVALVVEGEWSDDELIDLVNAAECWNTEFGTQLMVSAEYDAQQIVSVAFNEFACLISAGHYHARPQGEIDVCPPQYIDGTGLGSELLFGILIHELGHTVNIHTHGKDTDSIMYRAFWATFSFSGRRAFSNEDRRLFSHANADFPNPPCAAGARFEFRDGHKSCSCD